jgi:hypothetical protein
VHTLTVFTIPFPRAIVPLFTITIRANCAVVCFGTLCSLRLLDRLPKVFFGAELAAQTVVCRESMSMIIFRSSWHAASGIYFWKRLLKVDSGSCFSTNSESPRSPGAGLIALG